MRFEFDVFPLPELEWTHGSPFSVDASEDLIHLNRGHFDISMSNVCVITAPALMTGVGRILADEQHRGTYTRTTQGLTPAASSAAPFLPAGSRPP